MRNRKDINSPRLAELKKKRRQILRNKIIIFTFLVITFLIGLSFLLRWEKLNIQTIEIVDNGVLDHDSIKKIVEKELNGSYLWIFPKSNILFVPERSIKNTLTEKFKRIKDISVELKKEETLEISLSEIKASYIWCGEDLARFSNISFNINTYLTDKDLNSTCFFINEEGYVFAEAPYFSGAVYFKFFGSLVSNDKKKVDTSPNPIGKYFLPNIFSKLITIKDTITGLGFKPTALNLTPDGNIEIYLLSNSSLIKSPKIVFNKDTDLQKIMENIQVSMTTEPLKTNLEKRYRDFLYLDLRFGNKVYYKFSDKTEEF